MAGPDPANAMSEPMHPIVSQIIQNKAQQDNPDGCAQIQRRDLPQHHEKAPRDEAEQDTRRDVTRAHDKRGDCIACFIPPTASLQHDPGELNDNRDDEKWNSELHHVWVGQIIHHAASIRSFHCVCSSAVRRSLTQGLPKSSNRIFKPTVSVLIL